MNTQIFIALFLFACSIVGLIAIYFIRKKSINDYKKSQERLKDQLIFENIRKLTPKKGDYIILEHPGHLRDKTRKMFVEALQEFFPEKDFKVIVLEEGMKIKDYKL